MPVVMVSRLGALSVAIQGGSRDGAQAAAEIYRDAMVDTLLEGYTSGEYVTGAAAESVEITEPYAAEESPYADEDGDVSIAVGSDLDYVAYWEMGFHHAGNGQFYRVEKWAMTLATESQNMLDAYEAAVGDAADDAAL
jgi:hypothetical protein